MNALRAWLCRDATHFLPAENAGKLGIVFGQLFLMQPDRPPKTSKELYEILGSTCCAVWGYYDHTAMDIRLHMVTK